MVTKVKERTRRSKTDKAAVVFVCDVKPEARAVYLVGDFNNWDRSAHRMVKWQGKFEKRLQLAPGEYQFKFLVDDEWHTDPNAQQVSNAFGTMNSVIRVPASND